MPTSSIRRRCRSCWCISPAWGRSGPGSPGRWLPSARRCTGCASSPSGPAITGISRIAPTRPAGRFNSCSRCWPRPPRRKAFCGGPRSTGTITCIPIRRGTCIHPCTHGFAYSHRGWIFARRHDATDLTKVADLARYPELMWLHRSSSCPRSRSASSAFSWPAGPAWWSVSSGARCWSITRPSASIRSHTCAAASAM